MPYAAMVSQLGKMTEAGLLVPQSAATALVVARLMDRKRVANARIDPFTLLFVWLEYRQNKGLSNILDAIEDAFYLAFDNIEAPTGKVYLAIGPGVPVQGAAALAMALARGKGELMAATFDAASGVASGNARLRNLCINASDRLAGVCRPSALSLVRRRVRRPFGCRWITPAGSESL